MKITIGKLRQIIKEAVGRPRANTQWGKVRIIPHDWKKYPVGGIAAYGTPVIIAPDSPVHPDEEATAIKLVGDDVVLKLTDGSVITLDKMYVREMKYH